MPLRVLALVTDAYGVGGGIAQFNRDFIKALAIAETVGEIIVVTRNGNAHESDIPEKVSQLPAQAGRLAFTFQAVRVICERGPFDCIFCGHLYMGPLAVLLAKMTGASVWLQIHGIEAWQRPTRLRRWAAEHCQLISSVSRHTRRRFLTWANCPPDTVKVLPNTVDERFSPGPKPEPLLDRYQLRGKKVLLTVSRLASSERYKGHDHVIAALAELRHAYPEVVYMIVGDGDDRTRLTQLTRKLGVTDAVRFIGYVPDIDLPGFYRAADLFVMPSTGEGFGIVFLQAMASGVPVIAGDTDGSCDPLRDGTEGTLVCAHDVSALVGAIEGSLGAAVPPNVARLVFDRTRFASLAGGLAHCLQRKRA